MAARRTLNEIHPFIAEILEGKHDEILPHLSRACDIRSKRAVQASGLRPGVRVKIANDAAGDLFERVGKVRKVNPKTVSVTLDKLHEHDYRNEWRLPHAWLEVIPS